MGPLVFHRTLSAYEMCIALVPIHIVCAEMREPVVLIAIKLWSKSWVGRVFSFTFRPDTASVPHISYILMPLSIANSFGSNVYAGYFVYKPNNSIIAIVEVEEVIIVVILIVIVIV